MSRSRLIFSNVILLDIPDMVRADPAPLGAPVAAEITSEGAPAPAGDAQRVAGVTQVSMLP